MTSWWRLRTQAFFVLGVLLFLIVFLGVYALSEAKRHAIDADELFGANFTAASLLKQVEAEREAELRALAKHRVTGDGAYRELAARQHRQVAAGIRALRAALLSDGQLTALADAMAAAADEPGASARFASVARELDRRLESARSSRAERLRLVARDLDKIIFVAFLVAIGVTTWLAALLYYALLKPLESIKRAARRIREGELEYRVERFHGFAELSELRREFNAMASKIEELDRMKSDFLSTVSHELRTPLTALKEGLSLLAGKQGPASSPVAARSLDICIQSAKRLETMIQNLLTHAKMESGFYSFDERPKDIVSVVELALQGVRPIADRRGMRFDLRVLTTQRQASFSTEGITHVLENLVLNAVKYGDASHPIVIEIDRIEAEPVAQIEVRVTNHGRGLLPAELNRVFERFFRASNADGQKGVGLGLSVVKRIIEAHHGTVGAESQGSVTTFSFRIPQRYESAAPVGKGAAAALALALVACFTATGCSGLERRADAESPRLESHDPAAGKRLAAIAFELLDPASHRFNPDKGRAYLEFAIRQGGLREIDIPGPVLLELLKSERLAAEKSRALEQQLEIMKEIDTGKGSGATGRPGWPAVAAPQPLREDRAARSREVM